MWSTASEPGLSISCSLAVVKVFEIAKISFCDSTCQWVACLKFLCSASLLRLPLLRLRERRMIMQWRTEKWLNHLLAITMITELLIAVHMSKSQWSGIKHETKIYILLVSTSFFQRSCWSVMAILMWNFLSCLRWAVLMIYFEVFVRDCMIQAKILSQPTLPWNLHPLLKTKALLRLLITNYLVIELH